MKLQEINESIKGSILRDSHSGFDYVNAFASDLMSDVLRYYMENALLVTGLCTLQAIRTAEISNISCVIFARGKRVSGEMLQLAEEHNIAVIESGLTMFEISGILYQKGLKPVGD